MSATTVKKGQVLVRIDAREARQAVAGSQAQVAQARANLPNARANYERSKQLLAAEIHQPGRARQGQADLQGRRGAAGAAQASAGAGRHRHQGYTVDDRALLRRGRGPPCRAGRNGDPRQGADDRLRSQGLARGREHSAVQAGGCAPRRARGGIPSLNKWIDATGVTILPAADAEPIPLRCASTCRRIWTASSPACSRAPISRLGSARRLIIPASAVVRRSEMTAVYVVEARDSVTLRQIRLGEPCAMAGRSAGRPVPGRRLALEPIKAGIYGKSDAQGADNAPRN